MSVAVAVFAVYDDVAACVTVIVVVPGPTIVTILLLPSVPIVATPVLLLV